VASCLRRRSSAVSSAGWVELAFMEHIMNIKPTGRQAPKNWEHPPISNRNQRFGPERLRTAGNRLVSPIPTRIHPLE
jgi:hypothetical protein